MDNSTPLYRPLLIVKVGSLSCPATQEDIDDVTKQMQKALADNVPFVVTHSEVHTELVYLPVKPLDTKITP